MAFSSFVLESYEKEIWGQVMVCSYSLLSKTPFDAYYFSQDYFESYISVASTAPSVLCLIGNFLLVNK